MSKSSKTYLIIGLLTLALLLIVEYNKPKDINWFPSYVAHHKIPYGTLVFNELLPKYFPSKVEQVNRTPFEFLQKNDSVSGTYFFINRDIEFGEVELDALLNWVNKGNNLFLAAESVDYKLLDTLNLAQSNLFDPGSLKPSFNHYLVNENLNVENIRFEKDYSAVFFTKIDTLNSLILGEVFTKDSLNIETKKVNIVKQPFGKGEVLISAFPKAFTNYFILKNKNRDYTAGLLSYLDGNRTIYMDNHHKAGKSFYTSPMYIFLNTKEFKWAYYLVLIGVLFYVIFEGKRKQRALKVVEPLKNQTLAFTRTIANMYFEHNRQNDIAQHKVKYFLDYLRNKLYIQTETWNTEFYENLTSKSHQSFEDIKALFTFISTIQRTDKVTNTQLEQLNKKIDDFKAKADGRKS